MGTLINIEASIAGFHNPTVHKGLTGEEFLLLYVRRQARMKSNRENRIAIVILVLSQWNKYLDMVYRYFPNTLRHGK